MSDLDQFEIKPEGDPVPPPAPSQRRLWPLVAVLVVLLAAIGAYFLWFRGISESRPTAADTAPQEEPATSGRPEPQPARAVELPPLRESDPLVRELVGAVIDHPQLVAWLAPEGLARRFAAAVDNIAEGVSPRPHLGSLAPEGAFEVRETGDGNGLVVDPSSWRRYQALVDALSAANPDDVVTAYRTLEPLLDEAYRDLGYPDRSFTPTLRRALRQLIATPIPDGPVPVVAQVESFHFADPELEALTPAQKHLLRLGPENARRVQAQLRRILERL